MGKRVADQHAVMDRGWREADRLAGVIDMLMRSGVNEAERRRARVALRRYEESRQS